MTRQPFSRQTPTRALSSVYGKIEQMLLAYPGGKGGVDAADILKRYGKLFEAFRDRVTFVILGHFGEDSDLLDQARLAFEAAMRASQLDPAQHLIVCHAPLAAGNARALASKPHEFDHKDFIQDPFVVMETDTGATVLLEPITQLNPRNAYVAEQLAAQAGFLVQPTAFKLEGGNILIGDDFALVGKNTLLMNLELGCRMQPQHPEAWVRGELARILGVRYLYWVGMETPLDLGDFHNTGHGYHQQPFFHLDLFLTLTGKTSKGDEGIAVGKIEIDSVLDANDEDKVRLADINTALETITVQLQRLGRDLQGPRLHIVTWEMGGKILTSGKTRSFVPYSYNNAHIESFAGISRAYLPQYPSCKDLEQRIASKLKVLNIQHQIFIDNDFDFHASRHGSLHCLSKVLKRI
jgi:hypothetical protein